MRKSEKKRWKAVTAALLSLALCLPLLTSCGKSDSELTDGYFEASSGGLTWSCVLKDNGIYYFQSITGAVAGTWQEVDEEIEYIANFAEGENETVPDKDNPEYKTTNRCIVLSQFNGETQKVAYADGKLWNVSADFGMSTRNLTHTDDEWDETTERSITAEQFYDQKDATKLIRLTHNYEFRDLINGIKGTWKSGDKTGSYILSADGKEGSLTVAEDGETAEYTMDGKTVTLYKTPLTPVYEFTGTASATAAGETEPAEYDFRLALYDNGDADFSYYDKYDSLVTVDSGRYQYDEAAKTFTFSGFQTDANNTVVREEAGVFTFSFTDAEENGAFEKEPSGESSRISPVTISVTYTDSH